MVGMAGARCLPGIGTVITILFIGPLISFVKNRLSDPAAEEGSAGAFMRGIVFPARFCFLVYSLNIQLKSLQRSNKYGILFKLITPDFEERIRE